MKKAFQNLRDTIIAGILFLLPILILFVLVTKVFQFFHTFTTKVASLFGLKSIAGVSASTIVGTISLILLCILCGYLVRVAFFKNISKWLDDKLRSLIPGYEIYHQMAESKLVNKEEVLPYEMAAWVRSGEAVHPAFIMETMPDGKLVIFLPTAGDVQTGSVQLMDSNAVERCPDLDMKRFKLAISNLGLGFSKIS